MMRNKLMSCGFFCSGFQKTSHQIHSGVKEKKKKERKREIAFSLALVNGRSLIFPRIRETNALSAFLVSF